MRGPLLSVCLPTYKRGPVLVAHISAFLKSAQTDELEIVVSDNASDDGTAEVLSALHDPRLVVVRQAENVGSFENQLRAFEAAHGIFLMQLMDKDDLTSEALPDVLDALRPSEAVCGGFRLNSKTKGHARGASHWKGRLAFARFGMAFAHPSGRFFRAETLKKFALADKLRALDPNTRPYSTDYLTSLCLATGGAYVDVDIPFVRHNLPPYEGIVRSVSYTNRHDYYFTPEFVFEEYLLYVRFLTDVLHLSPGVRLATIFGTVRRSLLPRMTVVYRAILNNPDIGAWYGIDEAFRQKELSRDLANEFLMCAKGFLKLGALDGFVFRWAIAGCARRLRQMEDKR